MELIEVDNKKFEAIEGYSKERYAQFKEHIDRRAKHNNLTMLIGDNVVLAKEIKEAMFIDLIEMKLEETNSTDEKTINQVISPENFRTL